MCLKLDQTVRSLVLSLTSSSLFPPTVLLLRQENATVEFEVVTEEESGKFKAVNVTGVGGVPIVPPSRDNRRRRDRRGKKDGENREDAGGEEENGQEKEEGKEIPDNAVWEMKGRVRYSDK